MRYIRAASAIRHHPVKPVIGSRIGGIPELVESPAHARGDETLQTALSLGVKDGETGLLFEPGNVADLRSKIEYLLAHSDKAVEMGKNARKLVEEEYNAEKHYTRLMEIYQEAIERNKASVAGKFK